MEDDDAFDYILEAELRGLYEEKRPISPVPEPVAVKGACRHCGKPIGRGVWAHEKHCKATSEGRTSKAL